MPRLILMFESQVLKQCALGLMTTIGRLPDNALIIDNPAVSGHHACVFRDGDHFVVEDLSSTNGTFVNQKRITRHALQNGDVLMVGKHSLVFDELRGGQPAPEEDKPMMAALGDTVFLDTKQHKALLTRLGASTRPEQAAATARQAPPKPGAVLRVLDGNADQEEFNLWAHTSFIGKAEASLVRLKGWFKPSVAVAITRNNQGYVATRLGGRTTLNGLPLKGSQALRDGDVLRVSGLTLEFSVRG